MKLNESQLKEVYELLREKFLVMRSSSDGMVGVTPGNERYFPERNRIILGMPLASSNNNLSINEKPKVINVTVGKKTYKSFSLLPLCEQKKIAALDITNEKKKSLMENYKVKDEQACVPVLKTFHVHLPYYRNCLNYGEIITRLTLELYDQYFNSEKNKLENMFEEEHYSNGFKSKVGKKLAFNKLHEKRIEKQFFKFLKDFDAIEITSWSEVPLIGTYKGCENFDERLNYASYDVSFWKLPTKVASNALDDSQKVGSAEQQLIRIKRAVFDKANVEFDENACLESLPLISGESGKSDKTV